MPLLPRRFERLKAVLNGRMADLTVVLEEVEKPHNLSAILRSCDAVGVLEAHVVSLKGRPRTFNNTAQGSQKWVPLRDHSSIEAAFGQLRQRGFRAHHSFNPLGVDALGLQETQHLAGRHLSSGRCGQDHICVRVIGHRGVKSH